MVSERKSMMDLQEMVRLYRLGTGYRRVAALLGMSPNTERAYRQVLENAGLLTGSASDLPDVEALQTLVHGVHPPRAAPQQVSSAEGWTAVIEPLWKKGLGPKVIHDRLRVSDPTFSASLSAVKRLCLRLKRARGVTAAEVVIPVDTAPGDVAQVDFGYVGLLWDPASRTYRKAWVFVLVLGYSRHMWADIVFDQSVETWIRLHERAFAALGGVPHTLVPDNLKAAVIRAAFGSDRDGLEVQQTYREAARHYGFRIDPAPPRAPEKKGKVEAGVKYVKNNFMAGQEEKDIMKVRAALQTWLQKVAGERVHGTTHRRPAEQFAQVEKEALLPLPAEAYRMVVWRRVRVHPDSHVAIGGVMYSVPFAHVGKRVDAKMMDGRVTIYADNVRIADHRVLSRGRSTVDSHLPVERAELRHRSNDYWVERAQHIGPVTGQYIQEVFEADDVISQLRVVQAMVTHLEKFPPERAEGACKRAQEHGNYTYRAIVAILRKALDLTTTSRPEPIHGQLKQPRHARKMTTYRH